MTEIVYIEDIINELSTELNLSVEEVELICKHSLIFTYDLMSNPEVISIALPNLGVLHFNARKAKGSLTNTPNFKFFKPVIESQIAKVEEELKKNKDLVHSRTSFISRFKRLIAKDKKSTRLVSKAEVYKLLETKQNKK